MRTHYNKKKRDPKKTYFIYIIYLMYSEGTLLKKEKN